MDKSLIIFLAIPVFFLMIAVELVYGIVKKKNTYRINDAFTSITIGLISRFPVILNLGFQGAIFIYFADKFNINLMPNNEIITWLIAFVLYDFFYYWMHRLHHEIRVLWATHVVHHHGEDFNLATALRQTSTGFIWKWIFFLPMIIIGIPGEVFVSVAGINLIYQFWVHTRHIGHLGWMEKVFVTPMNHGVHHAKNKEYIDANYGGVFIIWDRFFGTYIPEVSSIKPIYGTVSELKSWNPIWANMQVFFQMLKDTLETKKTSDKFKIWYSKTNWKPDDLVNRASPVKVSARPDKYNPILTSPIQYFALFQLFMLMAASVIIILTLNQQTRTDTLLFAVITIMCSTFTGMLLQNGWFTCKSYLISSILLFSFMTLAPVMNLELLVSQLFILYVGLSIFFISLILLKKGNLRTQVLHE